MIRFVFDPEPIEQFKRQALIGPQAIAPSTQNLTWLWGRNVNGETIPSIMQRNFQEVWAVGQSTWQRPTLAYLMSKAQLGYSPLTMVRTRRLYDSIAKPAGTGDTVSYGDAKNYYYGLNTAGFAHHDGASYPEIHNHIGDRRGVTRPFMYIMPQTARRLNQFFGMGFRQRLDEIHSRLRSIRKRMGGR
jgi:hypothetical protein